MKKNRFHLTIAAAGALLLMSATVQAQTVSYSSPLQPGNQNYTGNLGLDFNTNQPIVITSLGAFDSNYDGFRGTVGVAIFDRNTGLQVGPSVSFIGLNGTLANSDRFIPVAPFVLPAGGNYSVVAVGYGPDANGNSTAGGIYIPSVENSGGGLISFVGTGRFDANTTLDFPTTVVGGLPSNVFLAGTFQFAAALPPVITKSFNPVQIVPGGTSTLVLAIANPNAVAVTGVGVTDTLPVGVTTATPSGLAVNGCGGSAVATAATGVITLTGGTIAAYDTCFIFVNVNSTEGVKVNTTSTVSSTFGTGTPATATLTVASLPVLSKSFAEVSIGPLNTTGLRFTLRNPNTTVPLTGLAFTDTLPAGLLVANPSVVNGVCDGGTIVAAATSNMIMLTNATLQPGIACTFTVNVTATAGASGLLTNTTSTVASNEAGAGLPATARIFVGDPFQVTYVSNLASGDSFLDITNAGTLGASLASGTTASVTGAICANVYAFTPDEQLVSCCSCPVTPNGLVSFSAQNDLASNTLTPAVPTALVVKVVATVPIGGNSCSNSAASITTAALANGIKAYGTKLHAAVVPGTFGVTETPFSSATLSTGELTRMGSLCNFILSNGSGFGLCRACRLGGLGSGRQ